MIPSYLQLGAKGRIGDVKYGIRCRYRYRYSYRIPYPPQQRESLQKLKHKLGKEFRKEVNYVTHSLQAEERRVSASHTSQQFKLDPLK
jgi:hypothetical protein